MHAPAPWRVNPTDDLSVVDADGAQVADYGPRTASFNRHAERVDSARLGAVAPELADVLETVLREGLLFGRPELEDPARAALKKAGRLA